MERILHKVKGNTRKVVDLSTIERDSELSKDLKVYETLTKKDLIKIIQEKNNLLIQAFEWINELKSCKKKEG